VNPTLSAHQINSEARCRVNMTEEARRWSRRSDYDYVARLHENTFIARNAGLRGIASQKEEAAAQREANTQAVWGCVDSMLRDIAVRGSM